MIIKNCYDPYLATVFKSTGRVIALDVGLKRIGVAISDNKKEISLPLKTIARGKYNKLIVELRTIIQEFAIKLALPDIDLIIIGWPLHQDGKDSKICQSIKDFANCLYLDLKIPVLLFDERFSSQEAKRAMHDGAKLNRKKSIPNIDTVAATLILQNVLQWLKSYDIEKGFLL